MYKGKYARSNESGRITVWAAKWKKWKLQQKGEALYIWIVTGREDFLWCSVEHLVILKLWLNMLFQLTRTQCRGW